VTGILFADGLFELHGCYPRGLATIDEGSVEGRDLRCQKIRKVGDAGRLQKTGATSMLTLIASVDSPAWDDPRDGVGGGAGPGADPKWGRLPVPWSPGPGRMSSAMRADVALAVIFAPMCGTMCGIH
jgi:hypothetical protein